MSNPAYVFSVVTQYLNGFHLPQGDYGDPVRRQELSRAAVAVAQNPTRSWDAITRQFDDLIVTLATE